MVASEGLPSDHDARAFHQEVRPIKHKKMIEEILALNVVKFQMAVKIQLQKSHPDCSKE